MEVGGHDKFQGVPGAQLDLVAALDGLLLKGAVRQAPQVHQRHLGAHHLSLREGVQDVRDQACDPYDDLSAQLSHLRMVSAAAMAGVPNQQIQLECAN